MDRSHKAEWVSSMAAVTYISETSVQHPGSSRISTALHSGVRTPCVPNHTTVKEGESVQMDRRIDAQQLVQQAGLKLLTEV
jgi:hypothetical protein